MVGPQATIHHDDNGDGLFRHLAGPYPLAMLTYFSSTIRAQCEGGTNGAAYMLQPQIIHITGGSSASLVDVFNWMQLCCQTGRLEPLSNSLQGPTRHMSGLSAARKLGIGLVESEVRQTAIRLQTDLLSSDDLAGLAGDLGGFLQEHKDALIGNIARSYTAGRLTDVDRHIGLAMAHEGYYKAVGDALKLLKEQNWHPHASEAESSWLRREKLKPSVGQAVPMQPVPSMPMFTPQQYTQQGFMPQQMTMPMMIPPPPHSVYNNYLSGPTYWQRPAPVSYNHMPTTSFVDSRVRATDPIQPEDLRRPIHIHIHNNGSNHIGSGRHRHRQRHQSDHSDYSSSLPPRHQCRHTRHENCHSLTCNQKQITASDMVDRAQARHARALDYQPAQNTIDTPRFEAPRVGETLLNRRSLGRDHYLHVFRDGNGHDRYISKGPGFRFETNARNAERMLTYGCGCWLDADANRNFRDDGTTIGSENARYTCNSCIRGGTSRANSHDPYARYR